VSGIDNNIKFLKFQNMEYRTPAGPQMANPVTWYDVDKFLEISKK